jgi:S1-C subfamily serine protease
MGTRTVSTTGLILLAALLTVGAFQWGHARAAAQACERRRTAVVEAVQHVAPAVVSVYAVQASRPGYYSQSAGAGVVVHPDGYIVTNSHVIQGGRRIHVEFFGNKGSLGASLVLNDPAGDLALLKVDARRALPYVSLARTKDLMLGETAIAIGNPHGLGDTITLGIVSALGRSAAVSGGGTMHNLVQTDAAINTGNSGGPLVNLDGELIGINVSVLPSAKGIAFAIGGDAVASLLRRGLREIAPRNPLPVRDPEPSASSPRESSPRRSDRDDREDFDPGTRGVVTPMRPSDFGFFVEDDGRRLVVRSVSSGSAATVAGLRRDDEVISVDRFPVESESDLLLALTGARPGRVFEMSVRRGEALKRILLVVPR